MKPNFYLLVLLVLNISDSNILLSQSINKSKSELNYGIGLSQYDTRLDFPLSSIQRMSALNSKSWFEYDFFVNYNYHLINKQKVTLSLGLGYLLIINNFHLPVQNSYFNIGARIGYTNKVYYKNNISIPIEIRYKINNLSLILGINSNVTIFKYLSPFNKSIVIGSPYKYLIGLSDIEMYPGLRYDKNDIGYSLQYRLLNFQFKDDAMANNGKEMDMYNPVKFRLTVSKKLK